MNFVKRKLASSLKPTVILVENKDGSWTVSRKAGPIEVNTAFILFI